MRREEWARRGWGWDGSWGKERRLEDNGYEERTDCVKKKKEKKKKKSSRRH